MAVLWVYNPALDNIAIVQDKNGYYPPDTSNYTTGESKVRNLVNFPPDVVASFGSSPNFQ